MRMRHATLLFLSADHFQAYAWDGVRLSEAHDFTHDAGGRKQFSDYLRQHREPAYLLVDIVEEDFRHETVLHLIGRNRRDLIGRKFGHYYRNTPFRQARVLYRHAGGRRDDEMLFSALTNPQRISPWLDTLLANCIPLAGIYSLPDISTPLLKGIAPDHVLLLSWEKHAGLRQTYFNKQHLHFSRLTPVNGHSSFGESAASETPRMRHYLNSLSLPPHGEVLDVFIICHADDRAALESGLRGDPGLRYNYLDIQALGERIKTKAACRDSDAIPLFLHLLATRPPAGQYANSAHTHYYLLWRLRRVLLALAAAIALVSAAWGGLSFLHGCGAASETKLLRAQARQLERETEKIKRTFPATRIPADDMKTAVTLMRELGNYFPPPEDVLFGLSSVLDKFTRVRPSKIAWQTSAADTAPSLYPAQVVLFEGELSGFGNNHRSALAYLQDFQQALNRHGYTATAQKLPLDISPTGSISGDLQTDPEKPAQFTLKLVWRREQ